MKQTRVLKESTDRQNSLYNKQLFDLKQDYETLKLEKMKEKDDMSFLIKQLKKES